MPLESKFISKIKSKRIGDGGEPTDHAVSMAWMKALRSWNSSKKIYSINPYVEVYQFRENVYGLFSQNCDAAGDPWQYVIIGPEKAMLIDTAFGLGDLKRLVDELTGGKPLMVVNTHPHPDHGYGNCRFDKVYCHEFSAWRLQHQDEHLWDYLFDKNGNNKWLEFDRADLPTFKPYEIVAVPDGYVFNLGGDHEIELKWVPGHHQGHAMFLDKKNRILIAGDGLCCHISGVGGGRRGDEPYYKYNNVQTFRNELAKLAARSNEFDSIFTMHLITDLPPVLLDQVIKTCDVILNNPEDYDYAEDYKTGGGDIIPRRYKYVWGFGVLGYTEQGVYPLTE